MPRDVVNGGETSKFFCFKKMFSAQKLGEGDPMLTIFLV